jgi:carbonic anhydrase
MSVECVPHSETIDRRRLIRLSVLELGGLGLGAVGIAAYRARIATAQDEDAHWSYEGETGPDHWGDLDPDYAECSAGEAQSPIDIASPTAQDLVDVTISYQPVSPLKIVNNGHTIQVTIDPGSTAEIDGVAFELKQFHFHTPSEHSTAGEHQAMELHFVHKTSDDQTAVLGVFLKEGEGGEAFEPIFAHLPADEGPEQTVEATVNPVDLLPTVRTTYRYGGSLTTPPCTEGVHWLLFTEPVEISPEQVEAFRAIIATNNRPIQPVNDRTIEEDTSA